MFVIGLTGGIATGKSNVSSFLEQKGAAVIDADILAREVVEPGSCGAKMLREAFGDMFFDENDCLLRKALGAYIFDRPEERQRLNGIMHPLVQQRARELLEMYEKNGKLVAVACVPLLFETGMESMCDTVWLMDISEEEQLRRLQERDGLSYEAAQSRVASQMPREEKRRRADYIIDSSGTIEETRALAEKLWQETLAMIDLRKKA